MENNTLPEFIRLCYADLEQILQHALQCFDECPHPHCEQMKYCLSHTARCKLSTSNCLICQKMEALMQHGPSELELLRQQVELAEFCYEEESGQAVNYFLGFDGLSMED